MVGHSYSRYGTSSLILWLILVLDQTRFEVITQESFQQRIRQSSNNVRLSTPNPLSNGSTISRAQAMRGNVRPTPTSDLYGFYRETDKTQAKYNKSLQTSTRRLQENNEQSDSRIPFWNIAHMINSIEEIEPALNEGANGIEVDISFDKRGIPTEAFHGFPCDCGRHCYQHEDFVKFLQHIGRITTPPSSSRLQLILFDLKLKDLDYSQKEVAGDYLASKINEHVYKYYLQATQRNQGFSFQPPIRIIVSINHVDDNVLVRAFINHMRKNRLDFMSQQVGFDVGMNDDLNEISAMWNGLNGATLNIWQGDGLTNCANIVRGSERLKEAISIRNQQGHFRKIYYWTADVMYHIRLVLNLGLDAILTNQPKRVLQVLGEQEFKGKYRMATPYDDPFAQYMIWPSAWKMPAPSIGEVVETVSNIKKTSENFVKTLPEGIAAVIKKVHESFNGTS